MKENRYRPNCASLDTSGDTMLFSTGQSGVNRSASSLKSLK